MNYLLVLQYYEFSYFLKVLLNIFYLTYVKIHNINTLCLVSSTLLNYYRHLGQVMLDLDQFIIHSKQK